jgi:hypothetical protein
MLGLRPIRTQRALFRGFLRPFLPPLLVLEVLADKDQSDCGSDEQTDKVIHAAIFS